MDKIYLVSFPRSGSTWMRFLLCNILYLKEDINYKSIDRLAPDVHQIMKWEKLGVIDPLVIKSHYMWQDDYSKVIYMYRDVRDVVLSYYHFQCIQGKKVIKGMSFDRYLRAFIKGERYGRWDGHVNFWITIKPDVSFILVKYELLFADPWLMLRKIVNFLGMDIDDVNISQAIRKSDFDELEKIRRRDGVDPKIKGLRGRPGGWKDVLTEGQRDLIWREFGKTMEKLEYEKEKTNEV